MRSVPEARDGLIRSIAENRAYLPTIVLKTPVNANQKIASQDTSKVDPFTNNRLLKLLETQMKFPNRWPLTLKDLFLQADDSGIDPTRLNAF